MGWLIRIFVFTQFPNVFLCVSYVSVCEWNQDPPKVKATCNRKLWGKKVDAHGAVTSQPGVADRRVTVTVQP